MPVRSPTITAGLALAALFDSGCAVDRWLFVALDPGPFEPGAAPPAPDYSRPEAWAALPTLADAADTALPELPAIDWARAPADVFYAHPTTWLGRA